MLLSSPGQLLHFPSPPLPRPLTVLAASSGGVQDLASVPAVEGVAVPVQWVVEGSEVPIGDQAGSVTLCLLRSRSHSVQWSWALQAVFCSHKARAEIWPIKDMVALEERGAGFEVPSGPNKSRPLGLLRTLARSSMGSQKSQGMGL